MPKYLGPREVYIEQRKLERRLARERAEQSLESPPASAGTGQTANGIADLAAPVNQGDPSGAVSETFKSFEDEIAELNIKVGKLNE